MRRFIALLAILFVSSAAAMGEPAVKKEAWRDKLLRPATEFAQMPFWFWNDELSDAETKRQLTEFRKKGVYGFVIHARMGLPRSIPYMGEVWMQRVRFAVDEAARTGMHVCLYDEGMYPSGSAHGAVVRSNPAFAAQGIVVKARDVKGPTQVTIDTLSRVKLVAAVAARVVDDKGKLDLRGAKIATQDGTKLDLPAGAWRVMTFTCEPSTGHIRGVHYGEEDGDPGAPPAADLLSFEAMQAFIRFAYEPYYKALKEHFGKTVFAMFTDEPSMLGRGHRRGMKPWTDGLDDYFKKQRGYDLIPLLPALFFDVGDRTRQIRDDYDLTLAERLDETYYQQISRWCDAHGIALTGHPAHSDEIRPLRLFQIPSQDMVWRWALPGHHALEGAHSTVGKCSSSAARHDRRRRNGNEIYGAYGWHLTMDEMKWLADWLIVRGVNLLYPHAFYYTIRDKRAYERPPDLGMFNAWWPHYRIFADYTSRLCGLMSDGKHVCDVAVLSVNNSLPTRAAKWLFQHQVDFYYLEDWRLCEQVKIDAGKLCVGEMAYSVLIVDHDRPLADDVAKRVKAFKDAGGMVQVWRNDKAGAFGKTLRARDDLRGLVVCEPPAPNLRVAQVEKDGMHFVLCVNEGEGPIDTTMTCRASGRPQWFDAWDGAFAGAAVTRFDDKTLTVKVRLDRRGSLILCVDPKGRPLMAADARAVAGQAKTIVIDGPWRVVDVDGKQRMEGLGDWLKVPELKVFAGTLTYTTTFEASKAAGRRAVLDLGKVGDWAVVKLNGQDLGPRFWLPYEWDVTKALRDGHNELVVEVTNSYANKYTPKKARPAGLMGPVVLRVR